NRCAARVEEQNALGVQPRHVVAVDLYVWLIRMRGEAVCWLLVVGYRLPGGWLSRCAVLGLSGCRVLGLSGEIDACCCGGRWPARCPLPAARWEGGGCPLRAARRAGGRERHFPFARRDGIRHYRADHGGDDERGRHNEM